MCFIADEWLSLPSMGEAVLYIKGKVILGRRKMYKFEVGNFSYRTSLLSNLLENCLKYVDAQINGENLHGKVYRQSARKLTCRKRGTGQMGKPMKVLHMPTTMKNKDSEEL